MHIKLDALRNIAKTLPCIHAHHLNKKNKLQLTHVISEESMKAVFRLFLLQSTKHSLGDPAEFC